MRSARRWATASRSSRRTTAKWAGLKECPREFRAERAFPSGVRGPVELAALARLAARRLGEMGFFGMGVLSTSAVARGHGEDGRGMGVGIEGKGNIGVKLVVNEKGLLISAAPKARKKTRPPITAEVSKPLSERNRSVRPVV